MQSAAVLSAFETALPDDERIVRKLMFGTPCAFVHRQMFFGTFEDTLVARIGPERVKALVDQPGAQVFCLSEGKVWDDYVQLDPSFDAEQLSALAAEALTWAAALPRKLKAPKALRRSRRRAKAKGPRD